MMTNRVARPLSVLPLLLLAHCAPLTFSSEPALDFDTYRSVWVDVVATNDYSDYATRYLADQLSRSSGFAAVSVDAAVPTDLVLEVELAVSEDIEIDEEGDAYVEYEGAARYRAFTPDGTLVDAGENEDTSESELEAVEDLLDEIEYHYLEPYRY